MTRYVTIAMLCKHAGKHRSSVIRALRFANVKQEKFPGARGVRITEKEANAFLAKYWPEAGPLPMPIAKPPT